MAKHHYFVFGIFGGPIGGPIASNNFGNMCSDSQVLLQPRQISAENTKSVRGVRDPKFRYFLRKRNIHINTTDASPELVKRAKEIITNEEFFPEMDDALAKKLEGTAWKLETETKMALISELITPLIPALGIVPYESLARSQNKTRSCAIDVPFDPEVAAIYPPLPKSKPDTIFGYSETAFNVDQLMASDYLIPQPNQDYTMPDGTVRFPFLDLESKAQASGETHFIATNQVANAGAVAMGVTLESARRISAEGNIDFNEPQFFSISIDHILMSTG